jgi:hypothetical protein
MQKFFIAAAALALSATVAFAAAGFTSPGAGSPQRRAVLDALRPAVERQLGAHPIEFVVEEIRVGSGWAFVRVTPQLKGGGAVTNPEPEADGVHTEALLQEVGGKWRVREMGIGSTDVWYISLCGEVPAGLMGRWCEGVS